MTKWLKRLHLGDMKFTVNELEVIDLNPGQVEFGVLSASKLYLNKKYQLPMHQSIWEPMHLKSPHIFKKVSVSTF